MSITLQRATHQLNYANLHHGLIHVRRSVLDHLDRDLFACAVDNASGNLAVLTSAQKLKYFIAAQLREKEIIYLSISPEHRQETKFLLPTYVNV
jgi:hypothetical protein